MNHRAQVFLPLSKTSVGFLQHKAAEGLSATTLDSYERILKQWMSYAGDPQIDDIAPQDIRAYLAWLRSEYKPHCWSGDEQPLAPKTIRNI